MKPHIRAENGMVHHIIVGPGHGGGRPGFYRTACSDSRVIHPQRGLEQTVGNFIWGVADTDDPVDCIRCITATPRGNQ